MAIIFAQVCSARPPGYEYGLASWYGTEQLRRNHHRSMANGQKYDPHKMTAASDKYPLGTVLEVTNLDNGERVVVTVTDRGPKENLGRLVDVSEAAAKALGFERAGLTNVAVTIRRYKEVS